MRYIALLAPVLAVAARGGSSTTTLHGTFTDSAYSRLTSETCATPGSAEIRMSENCRYTPHYGARIS